MVNMKEKEAIQTARALLDEGENPLNILNTCSRAMETVGKRFESGEYFLPHLIMAGENAGLRDRVKIMIGGGQMSDNVKDYVGADAYCKDAIEGLNLAKKWTGGKA
jgi:methanogenic corrinoid protein MtbC1